MTWNPRDKYMWDFWFAERDGELHVFYLQADKIECARQGKKKDDLAEVGHAIMTPPGWRECKTAFERGNRGSFDDLSIWTGSIIRDGASGLFHMFYTSRRESDKPMWTPSEWQRPQRIGVAVSKDLMKWERHNAFVNVPIIDNPGEDGTFDGVAWRDPYVVKAGDKYWCLLTARVTPSNKIFDAIGWDAGGSVIWFESDRLDDWSKTEPKFAFAPTDFYETEVPQILWREESGGRRFYLLFSSWEKTCSRSRRDREAVNECQTGTYYLSSDVQELDDWSFPRFTGSARLLAKDLYAGKILLHPGGTESIGTKSIGMESAGTKSVNDDSVHGYFFGFVPFDAAGAFSGGLSDPLPVAFDGAGAVALQ